jgi:hypothetical protein
VKFDQLTKKKKKNFDQTPKLTENFDQLKMSSEIRSTDPLSLVSSIIVRLDPSNPINNQFLWSEPTLTHQK